MAGETEMAPSASDRPINAAIALSVSLFRHHVSASQLLVQRRGLSSDYAITTATPTLDIPGIERLTA